MPPKLTRVRRLKHAHNCAAHGKAAGKDAGPDRVSGQLGPSTAHRPPYCTHLVSPPAAVLTPSDPLLSVSLSLSSSCSLRRSTSLSMSKAAPG